MLPAISTSAPGCQCQCSASASGPAWLCHGRATYVKMQRAQGAASGQETPAATQTALGTCPTTRVPHTGLRGRVWTKRSLLALRWLRPCRCSGACLQPSLRSLDRRTADRAQRHRGSLPGPSGPRGLSESSEQLQLGQKKITLSFCQDSVYTILCRNLYVPMIAFLCNWFPLQPYSCQYPHPDVRRLHRLTAGTPGSGNSHQRWERAERRLEQPQNCL